MITRRKNKKTKQRQRVSCWLSKKIFCPYYFVLFDGASAPLAVVAACQTSSCMPCKIACPSPLADQSELVLSCALYRMYSQSRFGILPVYLLLFWTTFVFLFSPIFIYAQIVTQDMISLCCLLCISLIILLPSFWSNELWLFRFCLKAIFVLNILKKKKKRKYLLLRTGYYNSRFNGQKCANYCLLKKI